MSDFPEAFDTFTVPDGTATLGGSAPTHTELHALEAAAIVAIQQTLGLNPQGGFSTVAERIDAASKPVFGQVSSGPVAVLDFSNGQGIAVVSSLAEGCTFSATGHAAGHVIGLRIKDDGVARSLAWPAGWNWLTAAPSTTTAGKWMVVTMECLGADNASVLADWKVQA